MTELGEQGAERLLETVSDANSIMGRLRQKRQQLAAQKTVDLPVAGYGGELVVRYQLLDPLVEGKEVGDRVAQQFKGPEHDADRVYYMLVDSLIAACVGFYIKDAGDLVELDPEQLGAMTWSDDRLGDFLGFQAGSARDAVLQVFAGNRIAVTRHAAALQRWMGDTSGELDTGTLGI